MDIGKGYNYTKLGNSWREGNDKELKDSELEEYI